jgi:hypothetical protein
MQWWRGRDYQQQQALALVREEPSDPRRGPQSCGHARQSPARPRDQRCGLGPVRADHRRETRPLRAHRTYGVAMVGVEQNLLGPRLSYRRVAAADPAVDVRSVWGHATTAITTSPRSFSPPGGRRDYTPVEPR